MQSRLSWKPISDLFFKGAFFSGSPAGYCYLLSGNHEKNLAFLEVLHPAQMKQGEFLKNLALQKSSEIIMTLSGVLHPAWMKQREFFKKLVL